MGENLPDTNVGNIEYIRIKDALERFYDSISGVPASSVENVSEYANKMMRRIQNLEPADVAPVVFCKDCVKHNKKIGFDENFHPVWKEDACPLVSWRGKAQGCEFDYQFCCYGERKE